MTYKTIIFGGKTYEVFMATSPAIQKILGRIPRSQQAKHAQDIRKK